MILFFHASNDKFLRPFPSIWLRTLASKGYAHQFPMYMGRQQIRFRSKGMLRDKILWTAEKLDGIGWGCHMRFSNHSAAGINICMLFLMGHMV